MKKKILCMMLVLILSVGALAGCGGGSEAPKTEPEVSNNEVVSSSDETYEDEFALPGGIQTLEFNAYGMDTLTISYDGDTLFGEATEGELYFYDPNLGLDLIVYLAEDAQQMIDSYARLDWAEGYTASPITEQTINGMLVRSFTHSYTDDGNFHEDTFYTIPLGDGLALVAELDSENAEVLERAFLSIEGSYLKPMSESDFIIFSDASGNPVYKLQSMASADELKVISNENARIYFEFTTQKDDGSMLTRPAEIHLNAYGSGQDFFNNISGKYWTTYTPFEENFYIAGSGGSEKLVTMTCFWDAKVNGEIQQYQDLAFYFELSDGNLITGICDDNQSYFIGALFENGFIPAQ